MTAVAAVTPVAADEGGAPPIVALVPVRSGRLPVGAAETVGHAGHRCWLVGSGTDEALAALGPVVEADLVELGPFAPGWWAEALAPLLPHHSLLLPHSPDGRDLAPRLAATLGRPLVSAAVRLGSSSALVARHGGLAMDELRLAGPVVATLQLSAGTPVEPPEPVESDVPAGPDPEASSEAGPGADPGDTGRVRIRVHTVSPPPAGAGAAPADARLVAELEADRATMDLAEAPRIVAAGAGLGQQRELASVEAVAELLGASVGGTRVVTDWGWLPADRQIGTTGVMVHPQLYLAVGISGAVQHTAGLGHPHHIVAVNTDPSCPMMELADLALVCDGPAYLQALAAALTPEL